MIIKIITLLFVFGNLLGTSLVGLSQQIDNNAEGINSIKSNENTIDTSTWKTYQSEDFGIEFRYPEEWGEVEKVDSLLPSNNYLRLKFSNDSYSLPYFESVTTNFDAEDFKNETLTYLAFKEKEEIKHSTVERFYESSFEGRLFTGGLNYIDSINYRIGLFSTFGKSRPTGFTVFNETAFIEGDFDNQFQNLLIVLPVNIDQYSEKFYDGTNQEKEAIKSILQKIDTYSVEQGNNIKLKQFEEVVRSVKNI